MERGWKPNAEVSPSPPCPRCGSSNTKFCYYNNYSLTQPRYFCKGCRRYWTKGGSLRNVPIGGGCRKSRRGKSARADGSASSRNPAHNRDPNSDGNEASTSNNMNIDLAAVYANFLRQTPRPESLIETASELHEAIVIPPVEFSSFQLRSHLHDQEISGFFECGQLPARLPEAQLFGPGGGARYFRAGSMSFRSSSFRQGNGFMSMNLMENDMLPPLPGEEVVVSEGTAWPNSDMILQNQILDSGQQIRAGEIEPAAEQDLSLDVNGNMSMFGGLNLEAIFRS